MLWRYARPVLTRTQEETLLELARATLKSHLEGRPIRHDTIDDPALGRRASVFVTLKQQGELRGCVGRTRADHPFFEAVRKMSVQAATGDPRFAALTSEELDGVTIEVSVLSPLRRVTDLGQIEVGTHGLMVLRDGRQGLLLPQVAAERGWDRETYLHHLCLKAGLPDGCWQEGAALYAFTAVVFGEE
jgi:hypothetical protein